MADDPSAPPTIEPRKKRPYVKGRPKPPYRRSGVLRTSPNAPDFADKLARSKAYRMRGAAAGRAFDADGLTFKERGFANDYVATGGDLVTAAQRNYDVPSVSKARSMGWYLLKKPLIQMVVKEAMAAAQVTPEVLATKVKEALDATDAKFGTPDHKTRLRAVDMAFKVLDIYGAAPPDGPAKELSGVLAAEDPRVVRFIALMSRYPTDAERKTLVGDVVDVAAVEVAR